MIDLSDGLMEDKIAKRYVTHLLNPINGGLCIEMHPEDLKMIWICQECDSHFIFHADVIDHKAQTGHIRITKVDMILSDGPFTSSYRYDR
jgi:hypothetical protein